MGALHVSLHPPRFRVVLIALTVLAAAALWTLMGAHSNETVAPKTAPIKANPDAVRTAPKPTDATVAMSNARLAVAQVEACDAETGTFTQCQTLQQLGGQNAGINYVPGMPKPGQVSVAAKGDGKDSYVIRAATADGRIFRVYRTAGFTMTRTCYMAADRSPCPVPTW